MMQYETIHVKKQLRYLTLKEFKYWRTTHCFSECEHCIFENTYCSSRDRNCWVNHKELYSNEFLDKEVEFDMEVLIPQLSDAERAILTYMDGIGDKYKYMAKDKNGAICLYEKKPRKNFQRNDWGPEDGDWKAFPFHGVFLFIEWEDNEPYELEKLLKKESDN